MKKLLLTVGLALGISSANAQLFFTTNSMAAGAGVLVSEAVVMNNIQILSATNALVQLFDGSVTNVTGAYTNYTLFSTNIVTTYITTTGVTNNFTNTVLFTQTSVVAAKTNNTPPLVSIVVSANSPLPIVFNGPIQFQKNLTLSNNVGLATVVVNYRQP